MANDKNTTRNDRRRKERIKEKANSSPGERLVVF